MGSGGLGGTHVEFTGSARGLLQAVREGKAGVQELTTYLEQKVAAATSKAERAQDSYNKSVSRLASELRGSGATAQLGMLEKALERVGGAQKLTATQTENLVAKINALKAAGGTAPASLQALTSSAQSLSGTIQGQLNPALAGLSSRLGPLGGLLSSIGPLGLAAGAALGAFAIAGGAVANVLLDSTRAAIAYGDKFADLSAKNDIGTKALQHFALSAKLSGGNVESLTAVLFKLDGALDKAPEKFNDLGLSVERLKSLAPEGRILEVVEALEKMKDGSERNALAVELVGKRWGELRASARGLREGIGEMSDALGITMPDDVVESYGRLSDKLDILGETWDGFWRNLGASGSRSPAIVNAIDTITQALGSLSAAMRDGGLSGALGKAGEYASAVRNDFMKDSIRAVTTGPARTLKNLTGVDLGADALDDQLDEWLPTKFSFGDQRSAELATAEAQRKKEEKKLEDARIESERKARAAAERETAAAKRREREANERAQAVERAQAMLHKQGFFNPMFPMLSGTVPYTMAGTGKAPGLVTTGQERDPRIVAALEFMAEREASGNRIAPTVGDIMPGFITTGQIPPKIDKVTESTERLTDVLTAAAHTAQLLGLNLESGIGRGVAALSVAIGAGQNFAAALKMGANGKVDIGGAAVAGLGGIGAIANATSGRGRGNRILGGAGTGAMFGVQASENVKDPLSKAVIIGGSALVGGIVGAVRDDPGWARAMQEIGRDWGLMISEELGKKIDETSKTVGKGLEKERGRGDAALLHMGDLFSEAGGVVGFGADKAANAMRDLFSAVERGTITLDEAGKVFDENFGEVASAHISKTTGIASAQLKELIVLSKDFGLESEAVREFVGSQASSAGGAFGAGLASLKTSREKGGAGLAGQGAATGISEGIAGSFAAMLDAGISRAQALKEIAPAVAAMREELVAAGLEGGAAFGALEQQISLVSGEVTGPLLTGIGSFSTAAVNLHNINALTAEGFAGITAQIGANIAALEAEGIVGPAAMQALQPDLQKIWELQQATGFAVDETTAKYIEQGVASGAIGEQHRSAADKMLQASERTAAAIEFLAGRFGYLAEAVNAVPSSKTITVNTNYTSTGSDAPPDGGGENIHGREVIPEFAYGSDGLQNFGTETIAALHGWEAVMTRGQLDSMVSNSFRAGALSVSGGSGSPVDMGPVVAEIRFLRSEIARLRDSTVTGMRDAVLQLPTR